MLKKIIVTTLVVIIMVSLLAIPANAMTMSEDNRPVGVIGLDLLTKYAEAYNECEDDSCDPDCKVTMGKVDTVWVVYLEGYTEAFEGYEAIGCYDHYPSEKEMNILWANRITEDELNYILDEIGMN